MKKITTILFTLLFLSACVNQVEIRGNFPDNALIDKIEEGTSKSEVVKLLGSPSVIPSFSDDTWIYIGSKMSKKAFFDPVEEERKVIYLKFNSFDQVDEIEVKDIYEGMDIAFSTDKTKTLGQEFNAIRQIIGNIGRFNQQN